jgi:hypothetical protein
MQWAWRSNGRAAFSCSRLSFALRLLMHQGPTRLQKLFPSCYLLYVSGRKVSWYAANAKAKEGSCYVLVPVIVPIVLVEVIQNYHLTIDFGALF